MIKTYKNHIFQALKNSNLTFDNFCLEKIEGSEPETHVIAYKNTPFKFTIRQDEHSFDHFDFSYTEFAPDYPESDIFPPNGFTQFDSVLESIYHWIESISRYIDEQQNIDLWEEFSKGDASLSIDNIKFDDRTNFTNEEKVQVRMAINEFKNLILEKFELNSVENEIVTERLNYLVEAVETRNKFDWKGIAVSTIISISVALSLDTEKGALLFDLFKKVFNAIKLLNT